MKNLIPSEFMQIEEMLTEFVEKYIYLDHEIKLTRHNHRSKLLRRTTVG